MADQDPPRRQTIRERGQECIPLVVRIILRSATLDDHIKRTRADCRVEQVSSHKRHGATWLSTVLADERRQLLVTQFDLLRDFQRKRREVQG